MLSRATKQLAMSIFDQNGDHRISRDDFKILLDQRSTQGITPADRQVLHHSIESLYDATEMDNDASYTYEEYRLKVHSKLEEPAVQEAMSNILSAYFDCLDADRDGVISPNEYRSYMADLGCADPNEVDDAYNSIDSSGEGKIQMVEWLNYGFDYFYSENNFAKNNGKDERIQGTPCCGRQSIYSVPCPECFS